MKMVNTQSIMPCMPSALGRSCSDTHIAERTQLDVGVVTPCGDFLDFAAVVMAAAMHMDMQLIRYNIIHVSYNI